MADIHDLADNMLKCKLLGHAWDEFLPMKKPARFGDRISFLCVRCQSERHDIVSWVNGDLLQRSYIYTDGYHLSEKHKRADFRLAYLQRRKPNKRRKHA